MRKWLWCDLLNNVGHYSDSIGCMIAKSVSIIIVIYMCCTTIDCLRRIYFEPFWMKVTNNIRIPITDYMEHNI